MPTRTERPIMILDGGLGTSLEASLGDDVLGHPLWSTNAVINHPSEVVEAHTQFLSARSDIIETATYQASVRGLKQSGLSVDDARKAMLKAVRLAQQTVDAFEMSPTNTKASIALSLGPFGSILSPTQEFKGYYPPPYGPMGYQQSEEENVRDFDSTQVEAEGAAVDALAEFHLERLLLFSSDEAVWQSIGFIAFETILLPREAQAIRRAMGLLKEDFLSRGKFQAFAKPWWISFVCPDINKPHIEALTKAALSPSNNPLPTGVGINCTAVDAVEPLAESLTKEAANYVNLREHTLVLYPNGGTYDTRTQSWLPLSDDAGFQWAKKFTEAIQNISELQEHPWNKMIIGGCCRTDPSHIHELYHLLKSGT